MLATLTGAMQIVKHLKTNGANIELLDNFGRTAFQIALMYSYEDPDYAEKTIVEVYDLLRPDSFKVKINNRMVKIDNHQAEFFMLNFMIANLRGIMTEKIKVSIPAFETADFLQVLDVYPPSVISAYRRKRSYLSSILSKNEYLRPDKYNKRIFFRIKQGFYLPNPLMELLIDDEWVNVYKLVGIDDLLNSPVPWLKNLGDYIERMKTQMLEEDAKQEAGETPSV